MVNNECIHVMGGSTITLTFSPTPPLENARTRYRLVFGNRWLKGTNDDSAHPERIVLTVPTLEDDDDEDEDFEEFKYIIKVKGSDTLDPRVVVEE
jgi:hypothetical protein